MLGIFDENGNAVETTLVTVYGYHHQTGEYTGAYDVRVMVGTGIPGFSTLRPAPKVQEREVAVYADSNWSVTPDFRGVTVYSITTAEAAVVDYIGPLHDGYTDIAPASPFDKWNGTEWVTDIDAQHGAAVDAAEAQRQSLIDTAMASISLIQLKLQAGRKLTDDEKTRLNSVLDYIDAVTAVDADAAPDINWPVVPEA